MPGIILHTGVEGHLARKSDSKCPKLNTRFKVMVRDRSLRYCCDEDEQKVFFFFFFLSTLAVVLHFEC